MLKILLPVVGLIAAGRCPADEAPLRQEAYVWQRAWTQSVTNTVATLATHFDALVVLQAEVSWAEGAPRCVRAPLDYPLLRSLGRPVGLALRVGSFAGPFTPEDPHTRYLAALSRALVAEAAAQHLTPAELQLDFDCAESRLDGYRVWLKAIREAVRPIPVSLTALPSWLRHPEFKDLAAEADGFVLQVHSFERPRSPDGPLPLCDPRQARLAVAAASSLGLPFRVALPTYGYLAAFSPEGAFLGLSAEGPMQNWPPTSRVIEVRADPVAMSQLVRDWTRDRPPHLQGLAWYRLPMPEDVLNWRWATLKSVLAGTPPSAAVRTDVRWTQHGLAELDLVNAGTADAKSSAVTVRWARSNGDAAGGVSNRVIALDGLSGYQAFRAGSTGARFEPVNGGVALRPGDRTQIGWIRLEGQPELIVEMDR